MNEEEMWMIQHPLTPGVSRCHCSQICAAAASPGLKKHTSVPLFLFSCGESIIVIQVAAKIQRPVLCSGLVSVGLGLRAARHAQERPLNNATKLIVLLKYNKHNLFNF